MRWHAEHQSKEGEMNHPSDAAEWRYFQELNPRFAEEPRNVYLGLCTDGFNPFGMSRNHSLWPVILTPYNLPPGMCMNMEYFFLTILNSGPNHPRASLDIFLQPLIEELKELWSTVVDAYDVSLNQNFNLKVVLMWTISDFPAYSMLSGWTTHGKLSCPICMESTKLFYLPKGRKTCWFDCHRRFLPHSHPLRKNKKDFLKGRDASNDYPPQSLTGEQVYYERLKCVNPPKTRDVSGNSYEKKMEGYGEEHNWHKESILWSLSYWKDFNLRHNIDVMHTEKNFVDNILYTLMSVQGKSKDNIMSRLDIEQFCSRPQLHIDRKGKAPFPAYTLTKEAKTSLFECVKHAVKFPDGYSSDLASCVDLVNDKFSGMKSHDCHVFIERLLPFIFAELLDRNVHLALSGIGAFFKDLCSRTLQKSRVQILKQNIVLILCNLEKIFPPSFFDMMEHLPIHLPYEAELGGPVQLTRFNEGEVPVFHVPGVPNIFTYVGRPSGEMHEVWLSERDYQCAHAYVLRNCDYFQPIESMFEDFLSTKYPRLTEKELSTKRAEKYHVWVKDYVIYWNATNPFPTWVQEIVHGPSYKVKTWPMYYTRAYVFYTQTHGARRKTCNYGVCVTDQITLFKCKWYDSVLGRGIRKCNSGVVDVNTSRKYNKYEPFILDQVCYIPYPYIKKPKREWHSVLKVNPRGNISREYENNEPALLQTETDDVVLITTIEDLIVNNLVEEANQVNLDYEVGDADPEDEFLCNLSSSDDEEEEDEDTYA
ncbi:PREDICTED: uncharacterized protein LOC104743549 [Camelina sativa]|uniref:Uncharacterized protein LOC104743549 n=1 Tax=Camelina sativa TaxID=90675 RepID=A0ABM0VY68_CAMSA|nr:PREDICTED: uncharacterized protein LOC104743549 [Camelina sativa]